MNAFIFRSVCQVFFARELSWRHRPNWRTLFVLRPRAGSPEGVQGPSGPRRRARERGALERSPCSSEFPIPIMALKRLKDAARIFCAGSAERREAQQRCVDRFSAESSEAEGRQSESIPPEIRACRRQWRGASQAMPARKRCPQIQYFREESALSGTEYASHLVHIISNTAWSSRRATDPPDRSRTNPRSDRRYHRRCSP